MIALLAVQTEIAELYSRNPQDMKPGEKTRVKKRLSLLQTVKSYLESSPTEEFIMCEKRRLERLHEAIKDKFNAWCATNKYDFPTLKDQQKGFEKEYNLKKYKAQIKALSFIINK